MTRASGLLLHAEYIDCLHNNVALGLHQICTNRVSLSAEPTSCVNMLRGRAWCPITPLIVDAGLHSMLALMHQATAAMSANKHLGLFCDVVNMQQVHAGG